MKKVVLNLLTSILLVQYLVAYNVVPQGVPEPGSSSGTEICYSHLLGLTGNIVTGNNKSDSYAWNKTEASSFHPKYKNLSLHSSISSGFLLSPYHSSIYSSTCHLRL